MFLIQSEGFSEAYIKICDLLSKKGREIIVRGLETKELCTVIIKIANPRTRIINNSIRKVTIPFAIGEWLWCMEGRNDLEMISYYAPSYKKYSDDGITVHGAYGPRIVPCIKEIIEILKNDMYSRQAIIPIYNNNDVNCKSKDIPCTLTMHFLVRDAKLNMNVYMRSNDIYLGFPYDIFNFTMLHEYIATKLGVELGDYTHIVDSMHYYIKDEEKIVAIGKMNNEGEYIMSQMPSIDLDLNLRKLYLCEELIRTGKKAKYISDNYFSFFMKQLSDYHIKKYGQSLREV